jgi:hypothetical protein
MVYPVDSRDSHTICPSVRELDFPLVVPDTLSLYGPIVLDTNPVEAADPELNQWLDRGQTVTMSTGTHFHYTESQVNAVINGFSVQLTTIRTPSSPGNPRTKPNSRTRSRRR